MEKVRTILLNKSVFDDADAAAEKLRLELKEKRVFLVNVMSSPGAGKTTFLVSLINRLKSRYKIGVMEADIDYDIDAVRVAEKTGVKSLQLHTGGMCHLDAEMTRQGLDGIEAGELDIAFLENVGNLVCPAEYDAGAHLNMTILSVPEGDDKPLKYPLMYEKCALTVISKTDVSDLFDFDINRCKSYILNRNKDAKIIPVSAKTGAGMDEAADYFIKAVENFNRTKNGKEMKNARAKRKD